MINMKKTEIDMTEVDAHEDKNEFVPKREINLLESRKKIDDILEKLMSSRKPLIKEDIEGLSLTENRMMYELLRNTL